MLDRRFFARHAATVARDLLGATLVVHRPGAERRAAAGTGDGTGTARARVVETEAYVGPHDAASHSRAGRTRRTEVMFGPAGHAYVYLVYGMHDMLNVVTGREGDGEAVLLRAAEPLSGVEGRTDGPARLCRTLGVTVARHDGLDLCDPAAPLRFEPGRPPEVVSVGPRVGVDYAGDWAHAPLRFWDADSGLVSRGPRRAPGPTTA